MNNGNIRPTKGAKGVSGTQLFNGQITGEEYLADLSRYQAFIVYDKMRRGDGTVKNVLDAIALPIVQAEWSIDPGSDDKAAEFIKHELLEQLDFKAILREMLKPGLAFGFSVFEMVLALHKFKGTEYIGVGALESRKQKTIYAWETENKKPGITQKVISETYSIPLEKLLVFTNDKEGDNHEGISLLRGAYKHWLFKDKFYLMDAIKGERQSNGIPYAKGNFTPEEEAEVREVLENIRANEQSYLILPENATEFGFLDMKANTTADLMPSITHHDRQIAKSIQLQFIDIGSSGSGGSFAASDNQKDIYYLALEAIADNVASTFQKLIDRLIAVNFANVETNPKLIHSRIGSQDIEQLANAFDKFVSAGVLTPDADIEQTVRKVANLPEASAEVVKVHDGKIKALVDGTSKGVITDTTGKSFVDVDSDTEADADATGSNTKKADKADAKAEALKKAHEAKQRLIDIVV